MYRCFLCRQKNLIEAKCIEGAVCLASKKTIKSALEYLARCKKINDLEIMQGEVLCLRCYQEMQDYDLAIMQALSKQEKLIHKVEMAAMEVYSVDETDCMEHMATMDEVNDVHFFDDIIVDDEEIERTLKQTTEFRDLKKEQGSDTEAHITPRKQKQYYYEHVMECPLCAMNFRSKTRLQKHILSAHKKFKCELCEYSHRNEDYVKLHMNTHEGRKEESCLYCHKQFSTKISTIRHMEVHIDDKKYQCDKCGLCFSQTTILYNHKLQHEAEEQPLQCEICKQMFKTKRTYRHHMITHRPDRPRYCCEYCNKQFTEKYTLKVHKRTHPEAAVIGSDPDDQTQPLLLQTTPEVANTVQVQSETYIEDDDEARCRCIICDLAFDSKDQIKQHMENDHDVIMTSLAFRNPNNEQVKNEFLHLKQVHSSS